MDKIMEWYNKRNDESQGGKFIAHKRFNLFIPDSWLQSAHINENAEILYLHYTTCTVRINGYRLNNIYDDATLGKLGTVIAAPGENTPAMKKAEKNFEPYITSIIISDMSPVGASCLINNEGK